MRKARRRSRAVSALYTSLKVGVPLVCTLGSLYILKLVAGNALFTPEQLSALLARAGLLGPLIFLAALALRPILLLPGQAFSAVAGMLWGGAIGTFIALAGSGLSMMVVVWIGARLFERPLRRLGARRKTELQAIARRHDFVYALLITLNPLLPTDLSLALAAGAGARGWRLVTGAMIGTIPGTVATAWFGSALSKEQPLLLALSLAGIAASLVGGGLIARSAWRALKKETERHGARPALPVRGVAVPEPVPAD